MVNNHHFKDPCFPGVRKYLRIIYKCVPKILLKEVDPSLSKLIPSLKQNHENGIILQPKGSRLPVNNSILVSNSLAVYAYIKEHPERTALLFVSSVCMGLFITLCALVLRVSCRKELQTPMSTRRLLHSRHSKGEEDTNDTNEEGSSDSCHMNGIYRTAAIDLDPAEAAELAERIERREQIIQEIWMNSCLDGTIIRSINQYY
ncbi:protein eva-1-like protein C-like [Huso huso]|uniref:Protein eva-1-like protein C-like n=1 Tax=Huso huso TaxID=61971 RepID=A0ABR0Y096_HUSHU